MVAIGQLPLSDMDETDEEYAQGTIELLNRGHVVICANCPDKIKQGDSFVVKGRYIYCSDECAEDDEEPPEMKLTHWFKDGDGIWKTV